MPDATGSVTQFFSRLRDGEPGAADELWRRYCPRLLALARRTLAGRLPRGADPEDAVQSAFVSFWQRAAGGRFIGQIDRNQLWNLLGLITVRKALKQLQRERTAKRGGGRILSEQALTDRQGRPVRFEEVAATTAAPEFDLVCDELLQRLDDEPRAIALYRLMGYKNREIAELLGCTERKIERKLNLIRAIWEQEVSGNESGSA